MQKIEKISQIRQQILAEKKNAKKVAFVPTMGALHRGHLSLIEKARQVADVVVASVFVNKAQFNDAADYQKYPRQLESDLALLAEAGVDYVFAPDEAEIYAADGAFKIIVTKFVDCLCGATRAGHFDGVALIVAKLFNIINPDIAIFGEKDFQQVLVIKKLVRDLNFNIEILTAKTLREKSGLAMSSRNQRLDEAALAKAANIFRILNEIKFEVQNQPKNLAEILQKKRQELLQIGFEKIDYLEIRDEENLQIAHELKQNLRIFVALYLGQVRLIDNLKL